MELEGNDNDNGGDNDDDENVNNNNDDDNGHLEYNLEEQTDLDQGYNDGILDNHFDDADPQAAMDLDNEDEGGNNEGDDNQDQVQANSHRRITMMDFFAYRLQYRIGDSS
ncbi:hypothetical protein BGZ90_009672, partial [Linnemannia elongata]